MIIRPQPRSAVVAPARRQRGSMKGINGRAVRSAQGDMGGGNGHPATADPEERLAIPAIAQMRAVAAGHFFGHLHHQADAQTRQRPVVKGAGAGQIQDGKSNMVDHAKSPFPVIIALPC
ncbi:hypothetical protein D9M69_650300 [compost metagenome]